MAFLRPRRGLLWVLAIVVLVVAAVRIALNPLVARRTRAVLSTLQGYRGTFDDVSVSLWRLSYTIEGLKLVQVPTPPGGSEKRPSSTPGAPRSACTGATFCTSASWSGAWSWTSRS
jgi:hypothetical protein